MDGENAGNPEILDETNKTMEQESRDLPLTMSEQIDSKENIEHNFHTMTKVWRNQINHLQLVNNCEITCLQNECRILEECMYNHSQAHEALETILESSVEKIALYGKFEDMSRENNMVMRQVHQAIRDLKMDYLETNTQFNPGEQIEAQFLASPVKVLCPDTRREVLAHLHDRDA